MFNKKQKIRKFSKAEKKMIDRLDSMIEYNKRNLEFVLNTNHLEEMVEYYIAVLNRLYDAKAVILNRKL